MLNCTDLACVLHHHHFYAHLHHLKHHLADEHNDHYEYGPLSENEDTGSSAKYDTNLDSSDSVIQNLLNETESDLSSLSHVDAPNDVVFMVCGVLIAMLFVGLIIILIAFTISKFRKRQESSITPTSNDSQHAAMAHDSAVPVAYCHNPTSVWVFPPLASTQNNSVQNQIAELQEQTDCKFKRRISGKFKRLIVRKHADPTSPSIPPELKSQLKSIYVY